MLFRSVIFDILSSSDYQLLTGSWSHFHPPFSLFLREEKEKTGRARSKREKDVDKIGGKFWIGGMDNEKSITDLICFYFRCRCCWWLKWNGSFLRFWQQWRSNETGGHRDPPLQAPMQRQRGSAQRQVDLDFSFIEVSSQSLAPHLTNALFFWTVNGPFSFLSPEKRKWGVQFGPAIANG